MKPWMSLIAFVALLNSSCGKDLELNPRQTWKTDDMVQNYEVDVFFSESGFTYYVARAILATEAEYGSKSMTLPQGDSLTVNGTTLKWSELNADYRVTGTDAAASFSFVWTHEGVSYTNTITPAAFPPDSVPARLSKTQGVTLSIPALPEGTTAVANVNEGVAVKAPFFALPVEVGGIAESVSSDLSSLPIGHGVLTLLETTESILQSGTAAGGTLTVRAQFGYNIMIEE